MAKSRNGGKREIPWELQDFRARLRRARKEFPLTQEELGKRIELSQEHLSGLEGGRKSTFHMGVGYVIRWARETGVCLLWLLTGQEPMRDLSKPHVEPVVEPGTDAETAAELKREFRSPELGKTPRKNGRPKRRRH